MTLNDISKKDFYSINGYKIDEVDIRINLDTSLKTAYPHNRMYIKPIKIRISLVGYYCKIDECGNMDDSGEEEMAYLEILRIPSNHKKSIYNGKYSNNKDIVMSGTEFGCPDDILEALKELERVNEERLNSRLLENDIYYIANIKVKSPYRNNKIGEFLLSETPKIICDVCGESPIIVLRAFPVEYQLKNREQSTMLTKLKNFYKRCNFVECKHNIMYHI